MGRSLLGGSVFNRRPSSPLIRPAVFGRSAPLGLSWPLRHRSNLAGGGLTGHAPRFSQGGSLARLTTALRRSAGPKSPGRGWLRGVSSRGGSPRGGALGGASMGRRAFGGRRAGRSLAGRSLAGRGSTSRGLTSRGLTSRGFGTRGLSGGRGLGGAGTPRLRMPRPRTRRRWRTGGYR